MAPIGPKSCLDDYEQAASKIIQPMLFQFYQGGAEDEITLRDSRQAYQRYRLRPKVMRDVSNRDLSTTLLGQRISFPVCLAPSAFHKGAHPDGELATGRAAASHDVIMTLSCGANSLIEDVAAAAPTGPKWMQTYMYKDRKITEMFAKRAAAAGFKAVVLTVDFAEYGKRRRERGFDLYRTVRTDPAYRCLECVNMNIMEEGARKAKAAGDTLMWSYNDEADDAATWEDVKWLKRVSPIPVVVKGILSGEMAKEAVEAGADAILVSAHGGRQLDSAIAPLDALCEVVQAVRDTGVEVYIDGGIRTGADVFKALALGARAVFIGRPVIYGLACGGENGVKEILEILKDEFSRVMALTGCASVKDITPSLVITESKLASKL